VNAALARLEQRRKALIELASHAFVDDKLNQMNREIRAMCSILNELIQILGQQEIGLLGFSTKP
jgi:hypothetical protein